MVHLDLKLNVGGNIHQRMNIDLVYDTVMIEYIIILYLLHVFTVCNALLVSFVELFK